MLTETQKRALRAKTLLDSGMDAKEAAKKSGYKNVNGMLGAIALCERSVQKKEAVFDGTEAESAQWAQMTRRSVGNRKEHSCDYASSPGSLRSPEPDALSGRTSSVTAEAVPPSPEGKALKAKIYPIEHGTVIIRKDDVTVSYRPDGLTGPTVHIIDEIYRRKTGKAKWFGIVGRDAGGKAKVAAIMHQISEAAAECAALIEDELRGGERDVDHHA